MVGLITPTVPLTWEDASKVMLWGYTPAAPSRREALSAPALPAPATSCRMRLRLLPGHEMLEMRTPVAGVLSTARPRPMSSW